MFSNPDIGEICNLLREVKTIAVVGLSPLPRRPSYRIARALQGAGYRIVPVRPLVTEILGEKAFSKLAEVAEPHRLPHGLRLRSLARASFLRSCGAWLRTSSLRPRNQPLSSSIRPG